MSEFNAPLPDVSDRLDARIVERAMIRLKLRTEPDGSFGLPEADPRALAREGRRKNSFAPPEVVEEKAQIQRAQDASRETLQGGIFGMGPDRMAARIAGGEAGLYANAEHGPATEAEQVSEIPAKPDRRVLRTPQEIARSESDAVAARRTPDLERSARVASGQAGQEILDLIYGRKKGLVGLPLIDAGLALASFPSTAGGKTFAETLKDSGVDHDTADIVGEIAGLAISLEFTRPVPKPVPEKARPDAG